MSPLRKNFQVLTGKHYKERGTLDEFSPVGREGLGIRPSASASHTLSLPGTVATQAHPLFVIDELLERPLDDVTALEDALEVF